MDYEKMYREALERANFAYKDEDRHLKATLERIFPELRESEDEKIRKEIIAVFKGKISYTSEEDAKKYIAWLEKQDDVNALIQEASEKSYAEGMRIERKRWLEKQGEQASKIIIPKFHIGEYIKPKSYNEEHLIKDINENGYVLDVDIIIPFKDEDVWEIVEQKSAWSEEDEKFLNYAISLTDDVQIKNFLKSLKPKNKWKPSEQNIKDLEWCANLFKDKMGVGFHRLQVFIDELKNNI